jgi:anti-repressor protein
MRDLVVTNLTEEDGIKIDGRQLHMFLEVETPYHKWFPRMCEYGFSENVDYWTEDKIVRREDGSIMPQTQKDHHITLDMAKEIAMLQRNEKGKEARQYFIQLEKDWNSPEKIMSRALKIADRQIMSLTIKLEEAQPKITFADAVCSSKQSILIGELAKLIKQNSIDIGQNRLFKWLREHKYLMRNNEPTQKAMELKLFDVTERTINNPDGSVRITRTTKVTGKGQVYFINKFKNQA